MIVRIILYILFTINAVLNLYAVSTDSYELILASKPIICSLLILWLTMETQNKTRFGTFVMFGLFFGCLGDVFLMLRTEMDYFVPGLISFLLGHLFYVRANLMQFQYSFPKVLLAVLPLGFGLYFYSNYLFDSLGDMSIPVAIYVLVIAVMTVSALFRKREVGAMSYIWMVAGCILFLVSDSVLAYDKFVLPIENSGLIIMSTYILAQFAITKGALDSKI